MNRQNHKRHCHYALLSLITGRSHEAIQMYFYRHKLDIENPNHFLLFLDVKYFQNEKKACEILDKEKTKTHSNMSLDG